MTDKQPEALRIADALDELDLQFYSTELLCDAAAAELRRLHEVNAELVEIFKRIRFEQGFACECGIEDAIWGLIESAIAKFTGK
jgi:hypothetical protein